MDAYLSYFGINSSACNIPGQAKIDQFANFPAAIMNNKDISCSQISVNYLERKKGKLITQAIIGSIDAIPLTDNLSLYHLCQVTLGRFFNNSHPHHSFLNILTVNIHPSPPYPTHHYTNSVTMQHDSIIHTDFPVENGMTKI